jgi:hypothetical protein
MKCKRVLVHVKRDMTETIPTIVFCHEFAILQVIHGDAAVSLVEDPEKSIAQFNAEGMDADEIARQVASKKLLLEPSDVDPAGEYNRLIDRYGMHAEVKMPNVEYVYGRVNSSAWRDALKLTPASLVGSAMDEEPEDAEPMARRPRRQGAEAAA